MKSKILVTGGSGFIGSHLVKALIEKKTKPVVLLRKNSNLWRLQDVLNKIEVIHCDLENKNQVKQVITKIKPQTIYNLASYGVNNKQKDFEKIKNSNLDATIGLVEACANVGFKHFIQAGSCFEYGSVDKRINEKTPLRPETDYSVFKAAGTLYCQKKAIADKLPITILRPFTAFGPFEDRARLIPTLILNAINNQRPKLSSPRPVRNFIYVKDIARAFLAVTGKKITFGEIYNVCVNQDYSIENLVEQIGKIKKSPLQPIYDKNLMRSYESTVWKASYSKINKAVGWKPEHSLRQGLAETYNWFLKNNSLYK